MTRAGFYNEIHPKLRPVETVVDGVYICGACQGPKNSAEAVASGLAAVTQSASILKRGFAELDPLVGVVDTDACTWCGLCLEACPYEAPRQVEENGKAVAFIDKAACKGCGGCVPVCPKDAIDLEGYTDAQIRAMIDGSGSEEPVAHVESAETGEIREIVRDEHLMRGRILKLLAGGPLTIPEIAEALGRPSPR